MNEEHDNAQGADQVLVEQQVLARLASHPCEFIANIVSENIPGGALRFVVEDNQTQQLTIEMLPMPPATARMVVLPLCRALGHLHELGIMHRDVKPENVLVSADGQAKLTGFTFTSMQPTAFSLVGTPEFMAPETIRADPYTVTVDWWALGCLTSELLTGTTPFNRAGPDVPTLLRMILWDPITVPSHPHVGPLERDFIMALLQRNPSARLGGQGHTAVLAHPWFLPTTVGVGN